MTTKWDEKEAMTAGDVAAMSFNDLNHIFTQERMTEKEIAEIVDIIGDHAEVAINQRDKELTTLRFWREQGLHEIKRLKDEVKGLRERLVEMQEEIEIMRSMAEDISR